MIATSEDTLPKEAMKMLADALSRLIHGRQLSTQLLLDMDGVLVDGVAKIRRSGHKCPDLCIVFFESVGWVEIVRADLEHAGIQRLLQNVIVRFPSISVVQLIVAVRRAFPHYNPSDVGQEGERVLGVLQQGKGPKFDS